MPDSQSSGIALITADGVVGTSGAATRVFSIHILSGGGGAAVVALRAGTAVTDTINIKETGVVSTGKTFEYGDRGFLFPSGVYVDVDANTTSVAVAYSQ